MQRFEILAASWKVMNGDAEEYELALRARDGDRDALAELVERTRLRLFALAYAELRHYEDAQDALASGLLQICLHVQDLREPRRVRQWMQSIVRNEARRLRRGSVTASTEPAEVEEIAADAPSSLLRLDIERALRQLPWEQARAIRLYYLADLSTPEIARQMGSPEGTIRSWLHRGRQLLANEMEGYEPMTPRKSKTRRPAGPERAAALIHTDLEPDLVQRVTEALRADGYRTDVLTPGDLTSLLESLPSYQYVVLDETLAGRSAFELLINMRSAPETKEILVCVLCTDPADFTVCAYHSVHVDRLVKKQSVEDITTLKSSFEDGKPWGWHMFTERARHVILFAGAETMLLCDANVGTEHLLLGLLRPSANLEGVNAAIRVLERLGISPASLREATLQQASPGADSAKDWQLTPAGQRVILLSYAEACQLGNNYLGTEHLLLGLLREEAGLAAKVLTEHGATLDRIREEVQAMQGG